MLANEVVVDIDVTKQIEEFPYEPYSQRLFVYEREVTKVGLIHIPESSQKDGEMRTSEGYVIATALDVTFCKPGDIILYGRYSGAWQLVNGQRYRVMNEEDILAIRRVRAKSNGNGSSTES